jgi:glucose/arabinose dehydrogenase
MGRTGGWSASLLRGVVAAAVTTAALVAPTTPTVAAPRTPDAPDAPAGVVPSGFSDRVTLSGLVHPVAVAFAADGRVFVAEKSGLVKVFSSLTDSTATVFADLRTQVHNYWDRGMLGLALDPQFPTRPYVYVLYTYDAVPGGTAPRWGAPGATSDGCPDPPGGNTRGCLVRARLSRLTAAGDRMTGAELPLVTGWCNQFPSHTVGTLKFGPDGYLYASGGEGANFDYADYGQVGNPCGDPPGPSGSNLTPPSAEGGALRSQSVRRVATQARGLGGTIIRVDPATGAGAPGNPFASSTDANAQRIIAYGLRNPFRFDLRPGTDQLWTGDVGWRTWEEINRVADVNDGVAENFGWPCFEGSGRQPGYDALNLNSCERLYSSGGQTGPHYRYDHAAKVVAGDSCPTGGSSISGITFEDTSNYPASYDGALFFADAARGCVWVMRRNGGADPDPAAISQFVGGAGQVVQLLTGPGGDLFYVDMAGGALHRVTYNGANHPPTAVIMANPTGGPAPLTVNFDGGSSTDLDAGDSLRYAWDLDDDGQFDDSTAVRPTFTYSYTGSYRVRLQVTDQAGASDIETATVVVGPANTPPTPVIDTPTPASRWRVGGPVGFSGHATDGQEGNLPASRLSWSVVLNHCPSNCHQHPLQDFAGVASGSFPGPDHGYPTTLTLVLTATDAAGASASTSVQLDPATVDLTVATNPTGIGLTVNSEVVDPPATRTAIVGSSNLVSAPAGHVAGGTAYAFDTWSNGGGATHNLVAPSTPTTYTASYRQMQPGCPSTPSWFNTIPAAAGAPAAAPTPGGRIVYATLGPDGNHYLTAGDLGPAPLGAGPLECYGAAGTTNPAVAAGPGFVGLFAHIRGAIMQRTLTATGTGSWTPVPGGATTNRPGAVVTADGVVHLVRRDSSGRIYHATRRGTTWSGWDNLGGTMKGGAPAVAPAPGGGIAIFARGTDDRVHVKYGNTGLWTPWSPLDGLTTGTYPSVAWGFAPGQLDVFTTGTGGTLYHRTFQDSTHSWSDWMPLDTSVAADATLASAALPGRIVVYVTAGTATTTRQNVPGWPATPAPYTCATCVPLARTGDLFP